MTTVYYNNVKFKVAWLDNIKYHLLHRDEDKPAIIWPSGQVEYYKNGKCHREGNKPAVAIGHCQKWYKHGVRQRWGILPHYINSFNQFNQNVKIEVYHGGKFYYFYEKQFVLLQIFIKIFFHFRYNKLIWSPNYLGGKFVKKQILSLFNFS
jgi:hypothetical protein